MDRESPENAATLLTESSRRLHGVRRSLSLQSDARIDPSVVDDPVRHIGEARLDFLVDGRLDGLDFHFEGRLDAHGILGLAVRSQRATQAPLASEVALRLDRFCPSAHP